MRRFAVLVIALAVAPAFISATVSTRPVVAAPGPIEVDVKPELLPEIEAHPLPAAPIVSSNPCDLCFEYMTSLIEQLSTGADIPAVERPIPEIINPEVEVVPKPMPVPELPILKPQPLPIWSEAEAEEELRNQGVPLPTFIIRK